MSGAITFKDLLERTKARWTSEEQSKKRVVELIPESRLSEPSSRDRVSDRWSISFGGIAG